MGNDPAHLGATPAWQRLFRPLAYLLLGAAPALPLALLASLSFLSADMHAWLLLAGAWLGTFGLTLAAFYPPQPEHPRRSTLVFVLLLCGELAMAPLSGSVLAAGLIGVNPVLLLLILGPALVGAHYLGLCLLRFFRALPGLWLELQAGALLVAAAFGTLWLLG